MRPVSQNERLWEGGGEDVEGDDVAGLQGWLDQRAGHPVAVIGDAVDNVKNDPHRTAALQVSIDGVRRRKDAAEVALIERAAAATAT